MAVREFLTTTELAAELTELRGVTIKLGKQVLDLTDQSGNLLRLIEQLMARPAPQCAKCHGTGQFMYLQNSWDDCIACGGKGY